MDVNRTVRSNLSIPFSRLRCSPFHSPSCLLPSLPSIPINPCPSPVYADEEYEPLLEIDIGLLADDVRVTPSDSLDLGQGVHDLPSSIDVGVEETKDVLELHVGLGDDERPMEKETREKVQKKEEEGKGIGRELELGREEKGKRGVGCGVEGGWV